MSDELKESKPSSDSNDYLEVDIMKFRDATRDITFDVFLKLSEKNYAHVFSRTTGLDYKRLAQYISKGVKRLNILKRDKDAYEAFIKKTTEKVFNDPSTTQEKKIATLLNMTEQNMAELFSQMNVDEETAKSTRKVINNYVNLMGESPQTLALILKLVSHGDYLYYHSIATAIFSMFLCKASGQFNKRTLELVGLGGFLHDIGCTKLPKNIICSDTDLTQDQWVQMRQHPKIGLKMIENTPQIPDEVRYIVYQHHEAPGGKGYPNGLYGPVIYYPAKIVAIADAFSALISKRPFRPAFSAEKAIQILQTETNKFDQDLVKLMASVFGRKMKRAA